MPDILIRLRADAGQLTMAALIQEREAAAIEIEQLRSKIERLAANKTPAVAKLPQIQLRPKPHERPSAAVAPRFLRLSEVCKMIGVSRSTIYKRIVDRTFPQPVKISERSVRWRAEDVANWCDELEERT